MARRFKIALVCCTMFSFLVVVPGNRATAQGILNLTAGFGVPELLNIGARLQMGQAQLGLTVGTFPVSDERLFSISGDLFLHLAGSTDYSETRPWYARTGLNFLTDETSSTIYKYTYLLLRFGRELNFSRRIGIALDAGLAIELMYKEIGLEPTIDFFDFNMPVIPSLSASFFVRL